MFRNVPGCSMFRVLLTPIINYKTMLHQTIITKKSITVIPTKKKVYVKSTDCNCLHGTYIKETKLKFLYFSGSQQFYLFYRN